MTKNTHSKKFKKAGNFTARKGAVIFLVAFAAIGGAFMTFKSFAASASGTSITGKDIYGCPIDWAKRPTLRAGANGGCVWTAQRDLLYWQPDSIILDGKYGPQTTTAVYKFQRTFGLSQDGVVGPQTWANMAFRFEHS